MDQHEKSLRSLVSIQDMIDYAIKQTLAIALLKQKSMQRADILKKKQMVYNFSSQYLVIHILGE